MYTLDINFLSDRNASESQAVDRQPIADSQFLIYGGAVALVAIALVGGAFFFLNAANEGIQQELSALNAKEAQLDGKIKAIEVQEKQLQEVQSRTSQLLTLFIGNFPVSAIADDIRKRTPSMVQVNSISQASVAPTPQNPTQAASTVSLDGQATNYNELNDFLLLLKASSLLDPEKTRLVSSALQPASLDKKSLVNFQIQTAVTSKSPAELLPQLQRSGADGLVARVNLLRQQGVIK